MKTSNITIAGNEKEVQIKRILITWYNSQEKADLFKKWVLENYHCRTVVIEEDDNCDCYWIRLLIYEDDSSALNIVSMVQHAIQDIPTLAEH